MFQPGGIQGAKDYLAFEQQNIAELQQGKLKLKLK